MNRTAYPAGVLTLLAVACGFTACSESTPPVPAILPEWTRAAEWTNKIQVLNYDSFRPTPTGPEAHLTRLEYTRIQSTPEGGVVFDQVCTTDVTSRLSMALGGIPPADTAIAFEALPLTLRGMRFATNEVRELEVIPPVKQTGQEPGAPVRCRAAVTRTANVTVPWGTTRAYEVVLSEGLQARYWFAVDGKSPLAGALLQLDTPEGHKWMLSGLEWQTKP